MERRHGDGRPRHAGAGGGDGAGGDGADAGTTGDTTADTTAAVAGAMAEALDLPGLGADVDFFDAGGDSLRAITLVGALARRGLEAGVGDIFRARTPRALAGVVRGAGSTGPDPDDEPTGEVTTLPVIRWFGELTDHIDGFIQAV
ncbi:hypothetical protein CXF32_09310, partial [Corynebacterium bovis]|uniref:acyl carrier protein n=1 Tax=Corynebacterium bovis TaxID=36808 RepID=UPI000FACF5D9